MKTAIVYYSMSGNTEKAALDIASKCGADIIEIRPRKSYPTEGFRKFLSGGKSAVMNETPELEPYVFDAADYELVIVGMPIWASRVTPPIRSFIKDNAAALKGRSIAVFACCSGGIKGAEKAIAQLEGMIPGAKPLGSVVLVDPKDSPSPENDRKLADFCSALFEDQR